MEIVGHMSKRQRTNAEGHGVGTASEDKFEDPHKPPMSRVVHVRRLTEYASESHLHEAVQNFGPVRNIMMMKSRGQALIEFEDQQSAKNCVQCSQSNKVYVCGQPAFFNYSTSQEIHGRDGASGGVTVAPEDSSYPPNNILLFTVINPHYPITVEVMHTICSTHGNILRIVIFKKHEQQAMVEFETTEEAVACKNSLNGADIYSGCCTLKIGFAKTERLNVVRNDTESWDYTHPHLGKEGMQMQKPLLPDPHIASGGMGGALGGGYSGPGSGSNFGGHGGGRDSGFSGGFGGQRDGGGGMHRGGMFNGPGPAPSQFGDSFDGGFGGGGHGGGGGRDFFNGPGARYQDEMGGPGPMGGQGGSGAVLMMYGLDMNRINCDRIFNLLCLYGNVVRVKFLKSKEGACMVQMGDASAVQRCNDLLVQQPIFDDKIQIGHSKQVFIQEVLNIHDLPDGSPSYKDYAGSRNNRYMTPQAASKNRCQAPTKWVHYFNAPPNITGEELEQVFTKSDLPLPKITQFTKRSEKSSSGLFEFDKLADAVTALCIVNHEKLTGGDERNPYVVRLCFSTPPRTPGGPPRERRD